jgi:Uma2 family endonuclease
MLHIQPYNEVEYPTSDGEPMAESDLHRQLMLDLIEALRGFYERGAEDVYVTGNLLMYYEEGLPQSVLCPDVFVAKGIVDRPRETYKVWEEGKVPDLVIEVTSKSTKYRDVGFKKGLYEALGVREYLLFDPRGDYLKPRFQAYRLEGELFLRVLTPEEGYISSATGLEFRVVAEQLRIFEPNGGPMLAKPAELAELASKEKARAQAAAARAEAEAARADAEATRADTEASRADAEASRADTEANRADAEAGRADAEAARAARLEEELRELRARREEDET